MKYIIILLLLSISTTAYNQTSEAAKSKYSPGFQFWMEGARTKCTLIERFRADWSFAGTVDSTGAPNTWLWKVRLEENYGGSIGTVSAIGQISEQTIDLATGKAFKYKHKVIYYDSPEDCLSEKNH